MAKNNRQLRFNRFIKPLSLKIKGFVKPKCGGAQQIKDIGA